jgi:hypothetical protein
MTWSPWEVVDDGSWNGLRKLLRSSGDDEGTVEVKYEDVSGGAIIEENKRAETHKVDKDMWHVGHIPASVGMKWLVEEGLDMWSADPDMRRRLMRKLMDSDYRHLVPGGARIIL